VDAVLRELDGKGFDQVEKAHVAVVYKHSDRCFACRRSLREMQRIAAEWPDVPVYLVNVIGQRSLAASIAERFDIRHESPQAILVRSGRAVWHGSHYAVTADDLARELERLARRDREGA
jgi:bacillithiol system protein YtxJ